MTWKRARSENQKQERINQIVKATANLYIDKTFEEISFVSIAKEAKFTRSNLYKYFSSKEEIFLEFLKDDISIWKNELIETIDINKSYSIDEFVDFWVDLQLKHKRFLELLSLLYTSLEKNISMEHLVLFKRDVVNNILDLSKILIVLFPKLSEKDISDFINLQFSSAIGLYQMTNLSETQKKVLSKDQFKHLQIDFTYSYKMSIKAILNNILN